MQVISRPRESHLEIAQRTNKADSFLVWEVGPSQKTRVVPWGAKVRANLPVLKKTRIRVEDHSLEALRANGIPLCLGLG